ncbi:anti sigma factor C-terminal domain-containing protein [Pseudoflavonifractor phocaeensis]|uniref:anti sigma factor C-terminal domain-containing protein n=1 Tax=Pseudoflavonifractor phocaeensis TaxID=1870988 RepID=UPI00195E3B41|nr:anti sigma factor C-terminal domain-containing protein [Pseudoflavonifractor phocaeensis]MBM6925112.1 anti sigma factor C-terminal domain-containing protein [Pseudoflavonifractor phocaeensis]
MMFRELLEKYKNGTATQEERALVEAELEKSEAIADYLAEGLDALEWSGEALDTSGAEVKKVKRAVNRRLRGAALWAAAIVLAVVLAARFVVDPLVSSFYYQPNAQTVGQEEYGDALYDLTALYSLLVPGQTVTEVQTRDQGFGRYALTYQTEDWLTGETGQVSRTMLPGEYGTVGWITPTTQGGFDLLTMEAIAEEGRGLSGSDYSQELVDYLSQLPETSYLAVWVHFPERLNPIGFAQLEAAYNSYCARGILSFRWAAVQAAEDNQRLMGYQTQDCPCLEARPDQERYPMFSYTQMWEEMAERGFTEESAVQFEGSAAKRHFMTLLSYLADRPEAVEALGGSADSLDLQGALDYVTEHGVQIYGALVYAQPSALLRMWEDGVIDGLSIQRVLPSRYSGSTDLRQ